MHQPDTPAPPREKLNDIVILRSISILLVVLVHCYYIYFHYGFRETLDLRINDFIHNSILSKFRMPMFIFISGFLFAFLTIKKGKYPHFSELVVNKAKRLLIPYLVYAVLFTITLQGEWQQIPNGLHHLWFLLMLFWCFLAAKLLHLLPKKYILLQFALAYLLTVSSAFIPALLGLQAFAQYFIYFFTGFLCYKFNHTLRLREIEGGGRILVLAVVTVFIQIITTLLSRTFQQTVVFIAPLLSISIIITCYSFVNYLLNRKYVTNFTLFDKINKYSYGIYVYHFWFILLFLQSERFIRLSRINTLLFPLFFYLVILLLSILSTRLTLRTRIGRFLIG